MRKFTILSLIGILFILDNLLAQAPQGAYKIVEAQYGNDTKTSDEIKKENSIKIFIDGFWIAAFFGDPKRPFYGSGGGTYEIKDGKYFETIQFYSWDSTAVGATNSFDYKLAGKNYWQEGKINSDKYKDFFIKEKFEKITASEPLKNNSLEGVWKMQTSDWGTSKLGEGIYKDVIAVKIFSYPRFAFAYFNDKTNSFTGAGGGSYQFDGKTLTEHIEYWSWGTPKFPLSVFKVSIDNDTYMQAGWENGLLETWKKLHNQ